MKEIIIIILLLLNLAAIIEMRIKLTTKNKKQKGRRLLLDTSVLIDGRILDLAKTGFLNDELIITRSVMGELQLLADGDDSKKRTRARFGLDVIADLQKLEHITVTIWPDNRRTPEGVDERLLELAKDNDFALATIDYNLNKVAKVEDIVVLNMNELAKAIKTNILPGEKIKLKLIQEGQGKDQAVGYLEDGSMVVVENGKEQINKTVEIEIKRYLQTDAGKMIFAELTKKHVAKKTKSFKLSLPKIPTTKTVKKVVKKTTSKSSKSVSKTSKNDKKADNKKTKRINNQKAKNKKQPKETGIDYIIKTTSTKK